MSTMPSSPKDAAPAEWYSPTIASILADRAAGKPITQAAFQTAIENSSQSEYEANREQLQVILRSGKLK